MRRRSAGNWVRRVAVKSNPNMLISPREGASAKYINFKRVDFPAPDGPVSGRSVRCAKCGHTWFQTPPAPDTEADLVATSAPVHGETGASPSGAGQQRSATAVGAKYRVRGERMAVVAGWLAFAAIIG